MILVTAQPSPKEIASFTAKVPSFPVSARQLTSFARRSGASPRIMNFYKKFAPYRVFKDRDDLAASSLQVEIMRDERGDMPPEEERSPEED